MSFLCGKSDRDQIDQHQSMTPDLLTLSGEFVSAWSIRVAVWSVILAGLVIICSEECVKQNSKHDLMRWGISLLAVFVDFFLKIYLSLGCKFILMSPRRKHFWDSMALVLLNMRSRQFTNSHISGIFKIPVRTGLDLGRKISIKILCLTAKIRFL